MNIQCKIAGENYRLNAILEPGTSAQGAKYRIEKDGHSLVSLIRYPNGKYVPDGETDLTDEEVSDIGSAINDATDQAGL